MTDGEMGKKRESLKKMRLSAMMLQVGFTGENLSEFIQCQVELDALAEKLQAEHGDLVTPQQCKEAKGSLDAFVALIDEAQEKLTLSGNNSPGPAKRKAPGLD
jgi:cell division protein FtsB